MSLTVRPCFGQMPITVSLLTITGSNGHRCRVRDQTDDEFPLLIAVALAPDDRLKLAERVEGVAPLLLVASVEELRRLIAPGSPLPVVPEAGADRLTIDSARSVVCWGDREIALTRLEHDLLTCLNMQPLRVWSHHELHQAVWRGRGSGVSDVQSVVKRLRRKLSDLGTTVTITAVRNAGRAVTGIRLRSVDERPSSGGSEAGR